MRFRNLFTVCFVFSVSLLFASSVEIVELHDDIASFSDHDPLLINLQLDWTCGPEIKQHSANFA